MLLLFFNGTAGDPFLWFGPDILRTVLVETEEKTVLVITDERIVEVEDEERREVVI